MVVINERRMLMNNHFFSCPKTADTYVYMYIDEEVTTGRVYAKFPWVGEYVVQVSNPITYVRAEDMSEKLNLITYNKEDRWNMFKPVNILTFSGKERYEAIVVRKLIGGDPVHFIDDVLVEMLIYEEEKSMSVAKTYSGGEGKWLRANDLEGKTHRVVISDTTTEEFKDEEGNVSHKICLSFEKKERSLLLNKTNARALAEGLGDEEDEWIGKTIIMYPTTCEFQGSTVPCIRVRLDEEIADDDAPF
jgi:hypothetical protein